MKYYNEFADIYDEIYSGVRDDVRFYLNEAKKAKGPVLEVACGTGRILLPLLEAGVHIEGIDISVRMLSVLKKKAREKGLDVNVWKADMRNFRSKKKYALIIVPFRSFLHVEKSEEQIKTLKNFKKHLKKGGKIILNFFYPDFNFMAKMNEKTTKKKPVVIKGKKYYLSEKISYSTPEQLIRGDWIFEDKKGRKTKVLKMHLSYIYKKEFELLLKLAGFRKWKVYGGFDKKPLKDKKQEMVWFIEN